MVKRISIFIQLVLIMFTLSAIPAISVIYINNVNIRKSAEATIAESISNKMHANKELGDEMLTNIIYDALDFVLAKQYATLDGIKSYEELNSDIRYINAVIKMKSRLEDLAGRNRLVHSIFYYMDDADYVIATNGGLVKLSDYDNIGWMKEVIPQFRGGEGIWHPRTLPETTGKGEEKIELVSYLYHSSSLYTSAKVIIVINVYEDKLSELVHLSEEQDNSGGFLIDSKGNIIAHSDKQYLHQNLLQVDYISQIINSKKQSGHGITEDKEYMYAFQKSELYDWTYVNVYSLEQIYAQSQQIIRSGIGMTLVVILGGAVLAILLSARISKPIRELTNEIRTFNPSKKDKKKTKNEIAYLSGAFGEIRQREKILKESLSEGEQSVKRIAINNLLHGESLQKEEKNTLSRFFPYSHFIVGILAIDDFITYQKITTHEERKIHRRLIHEQIRMTFPEEYLLDSTRYNSTSIALLINIDVYDSVRVKTIIHDCLEKVQAFYNKETKQSLTIGVSQVHNYFQGVKTCGEEALEAVKRRLILGKGKIIFFQKPITENVRTYMAYHHEKHVMNYLSTGDLDKIKKEVELLTNNIKLIDYISIENIMLVYNQLVGTTFIYLNKHNYDAVTVLGSQQSNLYSRLAQMETVDEIKEYLIIVFEQIIKYQNGVTIGGSSDYSETILQYLKQNYQEEIDFEQLSRQIGISYSYARKLIRENTGRSLIDNLNLVRIEEAKQLLERSELTIVEISEQVGYNNVQSLYRFFKKFEGISPKDYRTSIINISFTDN